MVIISTISEASFHNVQGTTSRDLWFSLKKAYAPHSTSREYTLKTQLLRIEMHSDETPDAYLNRAQEYADALATISEPVKDKYLIMLAVSGLHEEYNDLKTTITALSPIAPSGPQAFYGALPSNNNKNNNNNNRGNRNNSRGNNNNRDTGANSHVTPDLEAMDNSEAYYGATYFMLATGPAPLLSFEGIIHWRSYPHTSEQKGFVKRRNRHVVETGLTLLAQACVP
ncbi:nucleotide-binding alpha-beta plait domain-containing protein [Tanacetum coccineum]